MCDFMDERKLELFDSSLLVLEHNLERLLELIMTQPEHEGKCFQDIPESVGDIQSQILIDI